MKRVNDFLFADGGISLRQSECVSVFMVYVGKTASEVKSNKSKQQKKRKDGAQAALVFNSFFLCECVCMCVCECVCLCVCVVLYTVYSVLWNLQGGKESKSKEKERE